MDTLLSDHADRQIDTNMQSLKEEDVRHVAELTRVGLNDAEATRLRSELADILTHFQTLSQIDTRGVPVTGHATDVRSVMRNDAIAEPLHQSDVLSNAPQREGDLFRVRPILD